MSGSIRRSATAVSAVRYDACAGPAPLTAVQFARADADGNCAITVEDVKLVEEIVTEGGLVGTSPRKELTWDAENRLIKVEPVGNGIFVNDTKCEFKYDYQGRRFEKKVFARVRGAWAHSYTQRFVWGSSPAGSGWLMLMVVDGSVTLSPSAAERKFTWGRDLSGHGGGSSGSSSGGTGLQPVALLTSAGGIGGLLAKKISVTGTFNPLAAQGLGAGDAEERTARATEQTAKHTKRLADAAVTGGLTFA